MKKYFYLQWKRFRHYLAGAVLAVLILMGGLLIAYSAMTVSLVDSGENQKVQVAVCGDVEDPMIQMGLTAITALDSSRYSLEVQILPETEAVKALGSGDIAAYLVVPEGFMYEAFRGNLLPLKMVTVSGGSNLVSIFRDEVTKMVAAIVMDAQKGVFGMMDGFNACEIPYQQKLVDGLTFQYVELILARGDAYTLEELGIADALRFSEYLLCGLAVVLLMLSCLPFAPLLIRQDDALGRMLAAKGKPLWKQSLCQLAAYLLCLVAILGFLLLLAAVGLGIFAPGLLENLPMIPIFFNAVPVLVMAAAMSYFLYGLSADLISGVLLQFFTVVALCFVSGCMYPVFFFPQSVQKLAALLPTGAARTQLAGIFSGDFPWGSFALLMGFSAVFGAAGTAVRVAATKNGGR